MQLARRAAGSKVIVVTGIVVIAFAIFAAGAVSAPVVKGAYVSASRQIIVLGHKGAVAGSGSEETSGSAGSTTVGGLASVMGEAAATASSEASTVAASTDAGGAGTEGAAGLDGVAGADGTNGVDGAEGPAGPAGADGSVGATGPAGPQGSTGATGSVGATGPASPGLTPTSLDGGGLQLQSPDGLSYRIHVTNAGIVFEGPTSRQVWVNVVGFQTLVP